ncbi:hypothetical protein ACJ41O_013407 [Fusarium nematophilum]
MKSAEFRPKLAPTSRPRNFRPRAETFFLIKDSLKPHTIVLLGSVLQAILSALLPLRWATVPPAILLLNSLIRTVIQVRSPQPSEYIRDTVPGRATAQLPSSSSGSFGGRPGASPIVVFHLGVQANHPLGVASPGFSELGDFFSAMQRDLHARREELGLLGSSGWRGDERASNNTLMTAYYFRDVEGVHRFAHEELHRKAWDWFGKAKFKHIGVFHETFCVPAQAYETVYLNCHPVLMGQSAVRTTGSGDEEEERWTNALVSADTPVLKTQWSRLSRDENGRPWEAE